ncbi:transposase [Pseudonocardia benzenivorans]
MHIICDNFSPHRKAEVADWCNDHDVELVFTPTYASWLNWIESEFTALRYFTLDGSDYPPTPPRKPPSPATSAGPTATPDPRSASLPSPGSAGPITYRTLPDEALALPEEGCGPYRAACVGEGRPSQGPSERRGGRNDQESPAAGDRIKAAQRTRPHAQRLPGGDLVR